MTESKNEIHNKAKEGDLSENPRQTLSAKKLFLVFEFSSLYYRKIHNSTNYFGKETR